MSVHEMSDAMSDRDWDELLSAYFDGEATPAERAEVEAYLAASPQARGTLREFSELSTVLRGLPRATAPRHLRSATLQAAERRATTAAPPPAARSLRRDLLAMLIGAASTAAIGLVLSLGAGRSAPQPSPMAFTAPAAPGSVNRGLELSDRLHESAQPLESDFALAFSKQRELAEGGSDKRNLGVAPPMAAPRSGAAAVPAPMAGDGLRLRELSEVARSGGQDQYFVRTQTARELQQAQVGDVLPYLVLIDPATNTVGCVELQVVDVLRGADQLQLLLSRNGAPTSNYDALRQVQRESGARKPDGGAPIPELFAIYVDAPGEAVAQTLTELADEIATNQEFVGLRLQPPVTLSDAVEASRETSGEPIKDKKNEPAEGAPVSVAERATNLYLENQLARLNDLVQTEDAPVSAEAEARRTLDRSELQRGEDSAAPKAPRFAASSASSPEMKEKLQRRKLAAKDAAPATAQPEGETQKAYSEVVRVPLAQLEAKVAANSVTTNEAQLESLAPTTAPARPAIPALTKSVSPANNDFTRNSLARNLQAPLPSNVRLLFVLQRAQPEQPTP